MTFSITSGKSGWVLLDSATPAAGTATLSFQNLPYCRMYEIRAQVLVDLAAPISLFLRFNGDAGANYQYNAADGTTSIQLMYNLSPVSWSAVWAQINNTTIDVYKVLNHKGGRYDANWGFNGAWKNTTELINRMDFYFSGGATFAAGSSIYILGLIG